MAVVYLVGMMGAGKTTVGKKLAKSLSLQFVDLDHEIEKNTGVTIPTIFEIEGENGFRRRESQVLERMQGNSLIVATGGGVVLNPVNRARMAASGFVVYLHASAELLYARTKNDKGRPLLQVADPLARIRGLVERRDPLYREVADMVVESGAGVNNTVNCIQKALESLCIH
jgi:shikimate kinase